MRFREFKNKAEEQHHIINMSQKMPLESWLRLLEESYISENPVCESQDPKTLSKIEALRSSFSATPILNQKYIPIPIIAINDRVRFLDTIGDDPPRANAQFQTLVRMKENQYTFKDVAGSLRTWPNKIVTELSFMTCLLISDKKTYQQLQNWVALTFNCSLPDVAADLNEDGPLELKIPDHPENSPARQFIKQMYKKYPRNPMNEREFGITYGEGDDMQVAFFHLTTSLRGPEYVEINFFHTVPHKHGVGARALADLQSMAKEAGVKLSLYAWDKGVVPQSKLRKFYSKSGFKPTAAKSNTFTWEPQ